MSNVTLAEVLGRRDIIEDCRMTKKALSSTNYRVTAELILKNGERRIFRAKAIDKNYAIREILEFVAAIEENTGESIFWRLKGDKTYYFSTNYTASPSFFQKAKKLLIGYFFDIE